MIQPARKYTIGDLVAELQKMPQNLEIRGQMNIQHLWISEPAMQRDALYESLIRFEFTRPLETPHFRSWSELEKLHRRSSMCD